MDRQVAWSDAELSALTEHFVPCADEVSRLQSGRDAECRLFQRFCDLGHYDTPRTTRQGIYVVAPSGVLLGSANTRHPGGLARLLEEGLQRFTELPEDERRMAAEDRAALEALWRWEDEYPEDGLVLEVTVRDLPRGGDDAVPDERRGDRPPWHGWRERAWNRDHAWFTAAEVATSVPEPQVGAERAWPDVLVRRLARCHLVDAVRGQTPAFDDRDVRVAELVSRVEAVAGSRVVLTFTGRTETAVEGGEWARGFTAELRGGGAFDTELGRFVAFELVAVGERHGATRYNERRRDPGPAPIGVVLRLGGQDTPRIAPFAIHDYGWKRRARPGGDEQR